MDPSLPQRRVNPTSTATFHLADADATEATGARLAPTLEGGMVVTLSGDLGAGKTTLVRGVLRALGWQGSVKSPSYPLVEHYPFPSIYFYHFDFYRFADPNEWETAGFSDCFHAGSARLIEWPERVAGRLPVPDLALTLAYPADASLPGRELALAAYTKRGETCAAGMIGTSPGRAP